MKKSSLALFLIAVLTFVLCIFIVRSEVTRAKIEILEQRIEDKQEISQAKIEILEQRIEDKQKISQVQIDDLKDRID